MVAVRMRAHDRANVLRRSRHRARASAPSRRSGSMPHSHRRCRRYNSASRCRYRATGWAPAPGVRAVRAGWPSRWATVWEEVLPCPCIWGFACAMSPPAIRMGGMADRILVLDAGTTSTRAMVCSRDGRLEGVAQAELTQHYPRPGWVEHDPAEIWERTLACAREVTGGDASAIAAIGITNQRETVVAWDRESGDPLARAIVWQDRRTAKFCAGMKDYGHEAEVQRRTGLLLDPYFSGTKMRWMLATRRCAAPRDRPARIRPSRAGWSTSFRAATMSPMPAMPAAPCCWRLTARNSIAICANCSASRRRRSRAWSFTR